MKHLPRQNRQRLEAWRMELKNHLYTPIGQVDFEGFTTFDRLGPETAAAAPMEPFHPGRKWGACWEYAWFRAEVTMPAACEGQRVILLPGMGGEQLIYVDGRAAGSNDKGRSHVTLRCCAQAGERISVLIESYAGHGARLEEMPPCPPERPAIPPVPAQQCTVKPSILAVWNEDAFQLHMDVEVLCDMLNQLPEKSLRHQRVAKALMDFTYTADFELPLPARHESFRRAREVLAPALACHNGSTAPTMWLLGQSHIDLAWLWPEEETWHKVGRTYANQLALMEEYPEYRFLLCEPKLLDMLRAQHPEIWERVRAAFDRGQIDPEGAFYIECDTNLPSGESLIRQLIRGKRWFLEHFGVASKVAYQPDTFGYSGVLPQILKKLDIPYFATQKLLRADPECERFPYQNFVWEGIDGSTVQALSFFKNNAQVTPSQFVQRWEENRTQTENIDTLLYNFGYGDGGGGANRDMLEMARRMADLEGLPRSRYGGLKAFFEETARQTEGNRWVGELYLAWHRGTLTTQRKTKLLIARVERLLHDAEALLAVLPVQERAGHERTVERAWDAVMFCQFHDVAGGVGIRRVHQEAETSLRKAEDELEALIASLRAAVPAQAAPAALPLGDVSLTENADGFLMENSILRVQVDRSGAITSIVDKRNGLPLMDPGQKMNDWRLYENVEVVYDGWEMSRDWQKRRIGTDLHAECHIQVNTPQLAELAVACSFGDSRAEMLIRLEEGADRIAVHADVDWQERRKLLKVHFASNVLCEDALHEIQFGHVKRPCHASHPFAADRYEACSNRWTALCEEKRGFAILTDGIRGVSTDRGEIALSLLRAPLVPDDTADRGVQHFSYAIMPFAVGFSDAGVVRAGIAFAEPFRENAGFGLDSDAIILETVKPADDRSGDVILRLYESLRTHASGVLRLPFAAQVYEASMDESETGPLLGAGREVQLTLKPFEIRTLRVSRKRE
ncbi:MAG: alpha-mannosidase [Clostridiales bacterium]|nr:alpha-mannosidase [Clostridiales bacterium]